MSAARGSLHGRELLVLSYPHEATAALDRLSGAERSIVTCVLSGASNADIARARGTSVATVAKQVAAALRKLGVRSRGELAAALAGARSTP